ncbi:MAG: tyrosine-type recombinase/integrase, partial [Candidatus Dormibacterales bacterium]
VALREHRGRQLQERLVAGSRWQEFGLIFTTSIGTPLDGLQRHQGVPAPPASGRTPQDAFPRAAPLSRQPSDRQGVPARSVMEVPGHSSIRLTMDTYGHLFDEARQEVAAAMDRALGLGS